MSIPNGSELPADATLIFLVSGGKVKPTTPPTIDAGGLSCHPDGISVTWVQMFPGRGRAQFEAAALATGKMLKVRKTGVIAEISAGEVRRCLRGQDIDVDVIPDCIPENRGHCLITGIGPDDIPRLMILARSVQVVADVKDVPGLVNA